MPVHRIGQEGYERLLKKSRWRVLKRKANLTAYLLKEDFQRFWAYTSPTWAGNFLDFWRYQTMRSRIEPMKKIARTLRAHRPLLLNYFKAWKQFPSSVVEGLNNKAKVTTSPAGQPGERHARNPITKHRANPDLVINLNRRCRVFERVVVFAAHDLLDL